MFFSFPPRHRLLQGIGAFFFLRRLCTPLAMKEGFPFPLLVFPGRSAPNLFFFGHLSLPQKKPLLISALYKPILPVFPLLTARTALILWHPLASVRSSKSVGAAYLVFLIFVRPGSLAGGAYRESLAPTSRLFLLFPCVYVARIHARGLTFFPLFSSSSEMCLPDVVKTLPPPRPPSCDFVFCRFPQRPRRILFCFLLSQHSVAPLSFSQCIPFWIFSTFLRCFNL